MIRAQKSNNSVAPPCLTFKLALQRTTSRRRLTCIERQKVHADHPKNASLAELPQPGLHAQAQLHLHKRSVNEMKTVGGKRLTTVQKKVRGKNKNRWPPSKSTVSLDHLVSGDSKTSQALIGIKLPKISHILSAEVTFLLRKQPLRANVFLKIVLYMCWVSGTSSYGKFGVAS